MIQSTHQRVVDLLHRGRNEEAHFLVDKAILSLSGDDVLSWRASTMTTREERLPGA